MNKSRIGQLKDAGRLLLRASTIIGDVKRMEENNALENNSEYLQGADEVQSSDDVLWDLDYLLGAIDDCIYTIKNVVASMMNSKCHIDKSKRS